MSRPLRHYAALLCAALLLQSCASSSSLSHARNQFFSGQADVALNTLETESVSKRNQLLALLDRGLIAHTAGKYNDSVIAFKAASDLLTQLDFVSVSEQSASLVTNDWVTTYKGEYSERLWVHTFQMMNFLLLNDPEGAAVEARQALQVLDDHDGDLNKDWYTRTLIAMSFEAAGKADSAHIEYKKLLDDVGRDIGMARRAWQNAKRLGRQQDADKFKKLITTAARSGSADGELVVFLQTGSIPHKIAGEIFLEPTTYASFPIYPVIPRPNVTLNVASDAHDQAADVLSVQLVDISRSALASRAKQITAKQILRIAAKKELARAVRKENDGLGAFLAIAFFASEIADTRSWETLPAHFTLVQIPLAAGTHTLRLTVHEGSNTHELVLNDVDIAARQSSYRSYRIGTGAPQPEIDRTRSKADTSISSP